MSTPKYDHHLFYFPPPFAIGSDVAAGSSRSLMGRAGLCVVVRRQFEAIYVFLFAFVCVCM